MSKWLAHSSQLTVEQEKIIKTPCDKNLLITGAPGSGKTLVLAYRAQHFLEKMKIPKSKIRFFVFTKSLKEYIKEGIKLLNIPDECINNFDSWCHDYYIKNISKKIPYTEGTYNRKSPDYFTTVRCEILKKLEEKKSAPLYDCVLVDEGQDMDEEVYKILKIISKHTTVCMDDKQQIYETKTDKSKVEKILDVKSYESQNIIDAWRCSPYIVKLASVFIANDEEKRYFLEQNRKPLEEKQVPFVAISDDYNLTNAKMAELIKERMLLNDTIAILASKNMVVRAIGNKLKESGIDVEFEDNVDFSSDKPKVMTYHKAKGLTFDSVFLPSLVNSNFNNFKEGIPRRMLFVGITRAIKWVYMDFSQKTQLEYLKELRNLYKTKEIEIQELIDKDSIGIFSNKPKKESKKSTPSENIEDML